MPFPSEIWPGQCHESLPPPDITNATVTFSVNFAGSEGTLSFEGNGAAIGIWDTSIPFGTTGAGLGFGNAGTCCNPLCQVGVAGNPLTNQGLGTFSYGDGETYNGSYTVDFNVQQNSISGMCQTSFYASAQFVLYSGLPGGFVNLLSQSFSTALTGASIIGTHTFTNNILVTGSIYNGPAYGTYTTYDAAGSYTFAISIS